LVHALAAAREGQPEAPCRLTVVTRRAAFDVASPRAAALWGAVRALGHELGAGLDLRLVDVGEPSDLPVLGWLARHDVRERELAIRDGRLYAPRLVRRPGAHATFPASAGHPYQLRVTSPGQITGLEMQSQPAEPPGPSEVEIDVAAAALNFRDVMVTLDLLPLASYERSALGRKVGIEASGTIRRTGSQVTSHRVGERVVFMKGGCIANRVNVDEGAVFPHPGALSMAESAAALSVYVTAYHALVDLARLRAGQRVLVHSALGGVGQAAIALARHVGATVYATAGTEAKREKLLGLGVAGAFDSHSFRWYDDLLTATGGEGVDVVLNSLAGPHIALCLQALRPGGWHCEIGKVDIYADAALGLSVFRKNLRFAAIDIDRLMHDDPAHCRELSAACLRLLADGAVPPLPVTTYRYPEAASALRFMASGRHEGKLVLTEPDAADLEVIDRRPFLDPAATYLVTGGLGGFGLHLLGYLVSAGARHLTLLDRDPARRRDADWVRHASGIAHFFPDDPVFPDNKVTIDIVPGDVSRRDDIDRCLAGLARPLKGVFHLAAVLDDHPLADVTPESVATVFGPKAAGAWHLHEATSGMPLDHFVLLSSIAAVFGNAGQSVYAAANAYLDGLAEYRRGLGLPALAYNMAAVAEAGMAARTPHVLRLMRAAGMPPVSTALAIANLDFALRAMPGESHLVSAEIGRLPGNSEHPDYMRTGRWMAGDDGVAGAGLPGLTAEAIVQEICREITKLSGDEEVGPQETIASFGVNSLSVAELIAFIKTRFNHHVSALDLMTTATPESIATAIIRGRTNPEAAPADASAPQAPQSQSPAPLTAQLTAQPPVGPAIRRPSAFANTWADHFPAGADGPAEPAPRPAVPEPDPAGPGARPARPSAARPRPLAGALPEQCQQDLELLQNTIRELTGGSPVGAAVPPDRFGAVFLTGATGFVGRFVLGELLRRTDHVVVHCLVRAESPARALDRIRAALESAQIWDDAYAGRIVAWPGDIREPRFGLPEQDFTRLCDEIDAVYHLAADLNLLSPYAAMREANTRSFRNVLELALLRRTKHVVYASTMGVFPQYFCNFANGFGDRWIEDEAQPDPGLMTSVFPPGLVGYPWSKLVVEQVLLSAQSLGLPVAIMRLPQMGIAAGTGYTQSSDIKIRIVMAVLDTGVMPSGFRLQWTEPVDTVSEILAAISLNPRRQHTIYHLCHPAPQDHGLELADFGFDVREVSYAEFRRACQARGLRGPLHGYWPLVDHFAGHWFSAAPQARPIAVGPVVAGPVVPGPGAAGPVAADTPDAPAWPGLITMTARSVGWVNRQAAWPYRRPAASLDAVALHRQAERFAQRLDVPFDEAYPPPLLEGLERLASALHAPAAQIREDRRAAISFELGRRLSNRAALASEYASQPAIAREPVERPVFILGINRTGTTLLHRLLAQGRRFWALYPHELAHPALPAGRPETARRLYADDILAASGIAEAMSGIHPVDPGEPEEEFALLEDSFGSWTYTLRYFVPEYARWLATQPGAFAYGVHRRTMQHLSWQRGTRLGAAPRPWLLKMPFHLAELETLVATYPDAVFIQTHREPREFMPSWLSLTEAVRSLTARSCDPAAIGAEQLDFMSHMLGQAARFRSANREIDRRFIDVSYLDLTEDPIRTVEEIYRHFGWTFDEDTRARTELWHAGQAARRRTEPRHRYTPEAYDLTATAVDAAFSGYAEFVRANKVRMR
jgi:thioester reductase-like protein